MTIEKWLKDVYYDKFGQYFLSKQEPNGGSQMIGEVRGWGALQHEFKTEEEALNSALETREVTYDDFTEEAGWTPAPDSDREESLADSNTRFDSLDGTVNVHDWQTHYRMAKESEQ